MKCIWRFKQWTWTFLEDAVHHFKSRRHHDAIYSWASRLPASSASLLGEQRHTAAPATLTLLNQAGLLLLCSNITNQSLHLDLWTGGPDSAVLSSYLPLIVHQCHQKRMETFIPVGGGGVSHLPPPLMTICKPGWRSCRKMVLHVQQQNLMSTLLFGRVNNLFLSDCLESIQ